MIPRVKTLLGIVADRHLTFARGFVDGVLSEYPRGVNEACLPLVEVCEVVSGVQMEQVNILNNGIVNA